MNYNVVSLFNRLKCVTRFTSTEHLQNDFVYGHNSGGMPIPRRRLLALKWRSPYVFMLSPPNDGDRYKVASKLHRLPFIIENIVQKSRRILKCITRLLRRNRLSSLLAPESTVFKRPRQFVEKTLRRRRNDVRPGRSTAHRVR